MAAPAAVLVAKRRTPFGLHIAGTAVRAAPSNLVTEQLRGRRGPICLAAMLLPDLGHRGQVPVLNAPGHRPGTGKGNDVMTTEAVRMRDGRRAAHQQPGPGRMPEATNQPGEQAQTAEPELAAAEFHAALREAFAQLPPHCRRLIGMLIQDPPVPDAQISATLGIPARSIRRNCHSCLQRLRRYPAVATLIHAETTN